MRKIHRLPQSLISKIAAGEVVERPAYAIKELIDNAIDAGASIIEIQLEESGLKRITVSDNGSGMSKDDLEICFLPHTTSKIVTDDDLRKITSLGFRGEALASIAAISHMTIITRTPKDIGGRVIQIRGGIVEDSAPIGSPIGTIVTAEGLFYSVPARKKFLKSAQTELRHITDIVSNYALTYPGIHFVLKHNKKTLLDFPKRADSSERLKHILGPSLSDELLSLHHEDGHIRIHGAIGKPQIALKQQQKQYLFINRRPVNDRMISLAVKEAFGTLLPASYTPIFFLSFDLPHEMVDVNVHPRKEQVAFLDAKLLFTSLKQAVTETLNKHNITFELAKFKAENSAKLGETTSTAANLLKEAVLPWNRTDAILEQAESTYTQLRQTYILTETQDNVLIIDQHAAHERILYETFLSEYEKQKTVVYSLPTPVTVKVSLNDMQIAEEYKETLKNIGFLYTIKNKTSLNLQAVPIVYKGRSYEKILRELFADLHEKQMVSDIDTKTNRMLAFLACRSAVKAGDILTEQEMKNIVTRLSKTEHHETCPHGRPTTITLSLTEIHKQFRR